MKKNFKLYSRAILVLQLIVVPICSIHAARFERVKLLHDDNSYIVEHKDKTYSTESSNIVDLTYFCQLIKTDTPKETLLLNTGVNLFSKKIKERATKVKKWKISFFMSDPKKHLTPERIMDLQKESYEYVKFCNSIIKSLNKIIELGFYAKYEDKNTNQFKCDNSLDPLQVQVLDTLVKNTGKSLLAFTHAMNDLIGAWRTYIDNYFNKETPKTLQTYFKNMYNCNLYLLDALYKTTKYLDPNITNPAFKVFEHKNNIPPFGGNESRYFSNTKTYLNFYQHEPFFKAIMQLYEAGKKIYKRDDNNRITVNTEYNPTPSAPE